MLTVIFIQFQQTSFKGFVKNKHKKRRKVRRAPKI